ncbi:hypothetical protein SAMD00023353_0800290 [Rosellinia necatrix]|uniref:T6SS Phospholipase effector Tle1-like catalytic domain-containing protein n=1 Tax=Rosellinia necatrix TaxID=77044 RepID=A0A1W2TAT0_ROSNE|nr:hypothetical protein SAMD00023353_0800290 [Rosellinia necatrix]
MTPRKLFVFCDGTWQDGINNNRPLTNVATLARCLQRSDPQIIVYYDNGIGNVTSAFAQLIDGATGRGISAKIRNAYSFLSNNYNFQERQDQIILVGFSRGAFAVQCLASFLSDVGLLETKYLYHHLRPLFTLWSHQNMTVAKEKLETELRKLRELPISVIHQVPIKVCAVWDAVSALGGVARLLPGRYSFVGKKVPKSVEHSFQALALNEKRRRFKPCVWESVQEQDQNQPETGPRTVSQCWFLGSHGDIGGNGDAALGAVTLLWMMEKIHLNAGIEFDEKEIQDHLKHKYLEWDYTVNRLFRSIKETKKMSSMNHSGEVTNAPWYWGILGWEPRSKYLMPSSGELGSIAGEIHFTVRLRMSLGENTSEVLRSWTTSIPQGSRLNKRVEWQHPRHASMAMNEHRLVQGKMEYKLASGWNNQPHTNMTTATAVQEIHKLEPEAENARAGLDQYSKSLQQYMEFKDHIVAPNLMYPGDRSTGAGL